MRIAKQVAILALIALFAVPLTSCGGYNKSEAKELMRKADKDKLTKSDCSTIVEWYEEYMEKLYESYEDVVENSDDYVDYIMEWEKKRGELQAKYPCIGELASSVAHGDDDKVGSSNKKRLQKIGEKYDKKGEKLDKKVSKMREKYMKKVNKSEDYD